MNLVSWNQSEYSRLYLTGVVIVAAMGILLFGYDASVFFGAEKGLQAFFMEARDFQYSDGWHQFTMCSVWIGCAMGAILSWALVAKASRKGLFAIAGLLLFASALGCMDPEFLLFNYGKPSQGVLLMFNGYRIIGGIGVGIVIVSCLVYISELSNLRLRRWMIGSLLLAFIMGIFLAWIVNSCILSNHIQPLVEEMGRGVAALNPAAQWTVTIGWRYMFGAEAIPAGLFMLFACFLPEKIEKKKKSRKSLLVSSFFLIFAVA